MRSIVAACIVALTCTALGACTVPKARTLEYLDQDSAATVSAVGKPLVFARARPELAAHARDYVRLVAVDVNRAGRHEQWLLAYLQSTLDPSLVTPTTRTGPGTLLVSADDRELKLAQAPGSAAAVGIVRRVHAPSTARGEPLLFRVDGEVLAFIAGANHLTLRLDSSEAPPFEIWSDGRASLAELVRTLGSQR